MKILYFGTICDMNSYETLLKGCKRRPSVATILFESALMDGFQKNDVELEIHSFPMVPTFPKSKRIYFGGNVETLSSGYVCRWLKTFNLPFFKQLSRRLDAKKVMRRWIKKNAEDSVILTYSIPPFLVKDIIKFAKRHHIKTVAIIPDLLENMYINHRGTPLVELFKQIYLNKALKFQGEYSGYIYLTEAMKDVVAPNKPYIVMEGILNLCNKNGEGHVKVQPRAMMYAGRLHEKYGVINLLDAFELAAIPNTELWLFGDGNAVDKIRSRAEINPQIRYFGIVSHDEILKYEQKATLLVNPRSTQEEFTKYSFPSKTIEYMSSGTPLITTKLKGIPDEYFEYVFAVDDNDVLSLKKAFEEAFALSDEELYYLGNAAKQFVLENKNAKVQTRRIVDFLNASAEDRL